MAVKLTRQEYYDMYGPTAGDKIHLADTGLIAEIEKDYNTIESRDFKEMQQSYFRKRPT
jgi:urease alpha subunit